MNIVEKEMDVYEIAKNLYTNPDFTYKNCVIHNTDLKNYFEMLILIVTEGLKLFFGDEEKKVDLNTLSHKDFLKIKEYLKKINIDMHLSLFTQDEWLCESLYDKYINYNKINIDANTKLEELYFIINSGNFYVLNFYFIY